MRRTTRIKSHNPHLAGGEQERKGEMKGGRTKATIKYKKQHQRIIIMKRY